MSKEQISLQRNVGLWAIIAVHSGIIAWPQEAQEEEEEARVSPLLAELPALPVLPGCLTHLPNILPMQLP